MAVADQTARRAPAVAVPGHVVRVGAGLSLRLHRRPFAVAGALVLTTLALLVADVIGRVVVRPSELEAGLMLAVIGAPVFIALVRGKRIAAL